tara:strand:- start:9 stop:521 length:513 start_codon:yes stop_codon:yes gene_type:complete
MKTAQVPAKRGRKKIDLSDKETLNKIKHFAGLGLSDKAIADSLGVSRATILRRKKDSATFDTAIKEGKIEAVAAVSNALFDSATGRTGEKPNISAQIFYLKNQGRNEELGGWTDRIEQNTTYSVNLAEIINDRKNLIDQVPTRYKAINHASNPDNKRVEGLVINQEADKK